MRALATLLLVSAQAFAGDLAVTLKKLPHVKSAKTRIASPTAETTIIHLLDWHFIPLDSFAAGVGAKGDELAKLYAKHLKRVTAVQDEHFDLLTAMLDKLDVAGVFVEGLTKEDMPALEIIRRVTANKAEGLANTILQHGAAGNSIIRAS